MDPFLGPNRDCRVLDAYRFDIITCQWYQTIINDHRNPFIYGFYHFDSVFDSLLQRNGILDPFWGTNRGFRALDAYRFDIIACQWYQCILIVHICFFITLVVSVTGYYREMVF